MKKVIVIAMCVGLGASLAVAQQSPTAFLSGVNVGVYLPASGPVRNAIGEKIFQFGLGAVGNSQSNLKLGTKLDIISANKNGNRLTLIPFTLEAEHSLNPDVNALVSPYVKGFAGLAYMQYSITQFGARTSATVIRPTYGAEVGLRFAHHMQISARYDLFQKTNGFDFSGLMLGVTVGF